MIRKALSIFLLLIISKLFSLDSLTINRYLQPDTLSNSIKFYGYYQEKSSDSLDLNYKEREKRVDLFSDDKLKKTGIIYRGFTIDNDGSFKLNSGLNLKLEGEIYRNLSIRAAINDDELALSSKGETESVSSIDNIFMEVEHPNFLLRLGDNQFGTENRGSFGNFKRELSGGFLSGKYSKQKGSLFYALTKSKVSTLEFEGIDGVQGPYRLSDKEGNIESSIIVPGSETIFINGEKLSKGRDKDYTIDYDFGEIFFTPFRVIKSGDKIVVDYEIDDDNYKKNIYMGDLNLKKNGFFIKSYYYSENDDYKNPIGFDMSDEYKTILQNGGDDPDSSYIKSAKFMGENLGTYNDTIINGNRYYIYAGENQGSYNVNFSKFKNGFYDREISVDGKVKYIYNPNGGKYMHYTKIPLPSKLDYNHYHFGYRNRRLTVSGEFAFSRFQRNSLSNIRDKNFTGMGNSQFVEYRPPPIEINSKSYGEIKLNFKRNSYNRSFFTPSRFSDSNFSKEYGVDLKDSTEFSEYKSNMFYNYKSFVRVKNSFFYTEINDSTKSKLLSSSLNGETPLIHNYNLQLKQRETENGENRFKRENYDGDLTYKIGNIFINPGYKREIIKRENKNINNRDKANNLISLYYDDNSGSNLSGVDYSYETNKIDSGKGYKDLNFINSFKLYSKKIWNSSLRSNFIWNRRDIHYAVSDSNNTVVDLIRNNLNYNFDNRYILNFDYEVNSTQESSSIKVYYETEPGEGEYSLVNGEYISDENGNWNYYIKSQGKAIPLTSVRATLNYDIDFEELEENVNILYWLSRFDTYGSISIEEKSSTEDKSDLILLNLNKFQNDSTIYGSIEIENNIIFNKEYRKLYFDFGFYYNNRVLRQYINEREKQKIRRYEPSVIFSNRSYHTKLTYGFETDKFYYLDSNIFSKDIVKHYYKFNISLYPSYSTTISSLFKYGYDKDLNREQKVQYYEISPEISYSFSGKGIVRLGVTYFRAIGKDNYSPSLAEGYSKGENYRVNLNGNYNINEYFSFNLGYNGRMLSRDKEFIHELNAKLKLEF
ncbi:MAG: hypothetical protein CR982_00880 [Candidatus Cloacimonadota bacterium]|nr:MAG: hypothetical protein CR982_00880 [Candidatus Cloacimonadota bacterium]PIE78410.1 MAG: hypothetical protein CSA15_08030 [Candidatus Delongbacteria bacterium]